MSDVFISYARSTESQAQLVSDALRSLGYNIWRDDELPAHRAYTEVIEERLRAAKAVVVIWSAEAVRSQWVRAEADIAREAGTLVQLRVDGSTPPLPFNQIQCADLAGWTGDVDATGWRKVVASVGDLVGAAPGPSPVTAPKAASPAAAPSKPSKPSIAVMSFSNLSNDPEQDYFAGGMAEEITTALSHYPGLFVVGVGAAHEACSDVRGGAEIAAALGVRYLLEGTVRKAGERLRITVKLGDAIDNLPVWSDRFDGALTDIFALQDEVAHAVAAQVVPNISAAEERRASSRPTADMTAYDLVLRVTPILRRNAPGATAQALALLERAIALDPDYGRALALAAFAHSLAVAAGAADLDTSRPIGLDLAARALKSQRDDPETLAYAVLAEINFQADIRVGARMIERALEHYPGVAMLWHASGFANLRQGRAEVAQGCFEEAMRLDPMDVDLAFNQIGLGMALVLQQRFEDAVPPLAEAVRLAPMTPVAAVYLAFALRRLGQEAKAKEVLAPYGRSVIVSYLQAQLTAMVEERNADF